MMAQEADETPPRPAQKKSAPAHPWSHEETMHLIDAYEERWTALRRGQLKAHQWEEVAAEVAARCAATLGAAAQRKTGTQCRHKLEKLRKRYRTEGARPVTSLWPYFRRMEHLERGPLPVSSAFPPAAGSPPVAASDEEEVEDEEEEEEDEEEEEEEPIPRSNNTRSINGILREFGSGLAPRHPQLQQPPPPAFTPSTAPPRKRVAYEAFQVKTAAAIAADKVKDEEVETARRPSGPGGANTQLSAVLRDFGEGIMRLERRHMEMQWEIERGWKETEARHARMLQDAQRQLRDTIAATCGPLPKKARRDHGSNGDGL
ncbi:uncharacterized protein LOC133898881 [Phragmites australis]|uniref:uncharacterized protein LOC133898881 n=1 Tax=Phragmites australis TaxID=29695 RepID=UPI002D76E2C3|nr:uncharacterized protein LOC133898881 [Phragmites australis]